MESGLKKLLIMIGCIIISATIFTFYRIHKRKQNYKKQIETLEIALQSWAQEYETLLPEKNGESIMVPLKTLKQGGYIKENFKNPKTKHQFSNQLFMKITKQKKGYQYQILDQDKTMIEDYDDINKKAPMVVLNGNEIEYAELNKPYVDPSYKAITSSGKKADEEKIEIRENGKVVSKIDTSRLTTYQLTYRVFYAKEDSTITRTIIVKDTEPPVVTMDRLTVSLEEAKEVDLLTGVSMKDNSNEKLKVNIIGDLASFPGKYILVYQVTDPSGNMTEKKRVIRVEE